LLSSVLVYLCTAVLLASVMLDWDKWGIRKAKPWMTYRQCCFVTLPLHKLTNILLD